MKRKIQKLKINDQDILKAKLLAWSSQFKQIVWLDSNDYPQQHSSFEALLAVDAHSYIRSSFEGAFGSLRAYRQSVNDFIFGYLGYDLKNDIEHLSSNNFDGLHLPDLYFFQPKKLFYIKDGFLEAHYLPSVANDFSRDFECIKNQKPKDSRGHHKVKIRKRISKKEYLDRLDDILKHIYRGDIYEMNFCQEFYAVDAQIDPLRVYQRLNKISLPPFASYLRINQHFLLSASPERFVRKSRTKVISQPIKGTARRLKKKKLDNELAQLLAQDEKERAENIMIVDLVRNDLAKTAVKGSIKVEELCKVYSFKQVHQLISTVSSTVDKKTDCIEILKSLFPMGSMTGAPKISAMEIIEKQERTKRSLYSGAVGYLTPDGDFDFNVVIRSIMYNQNRRYLSYSVGGAITAKSDPEKEYQECLLKAIAMKKALISKK